MKITSYCHFKHQIILISYPGTSICQDINIEKTLTLLFYVIKLSCCIHFCLFMKQSFLIYFKFLILSTVKTPLPKHIKFYHSLSAGTCKIVISYTVSILFFIRTKLIEQKDGTIYKVTLTNISTVGGPGLFKRISICIMFLFQWVPIYLQTLLCSSSQIQVLQYLWLAKSMWSMTNFA